MAQVITLPLGFEFRRAPALWHRATLRITGWERRDDGTIDSERLAGTVLTQGLKPKVVSLAVHALPLRLWEQCTDADPEEDSAEDICAGYMPEVLVHDGKVYHTKSEFENLASKNAWAMRDEFIRMGDSIDDVLGFLNRWGVWNVFGFEFLRDILIFRNNVIEALTLSPESWLSSSNSLPYTLQRSSNYPYMVVRTENCKTALQMTVTADLLRKVRFKLCAREDCRTPYAVESRHGRKYCCQYCGHLVSVRERRNKLKQSAAKNGNKSSNRQKGAR